MFYCDSDWHDGQKIDAHYMIRALRVYGKPDEQRYRVEESMRSHKPVMFTVCQAHIEPALHGMLQRWAYVRVTETTER